ncbi:N/A [soil metagenome]
MHLSVRQLIQHLGIVPADVIGEIDTLVQKPGTLDSPTEVGFAFCKWDGARGREMVQSSAASVVVVPLEAAADWARSDQTLIRSVNPRKTFILALPQIVTPALCPPGIHPSAVVADSAVVDPSASVGAHVYIGERCTIGPMVVLHQNVVIGHDVSIGVGSTIFPGSVIGADGFGYERDDDGTVLKFLHVGGVRIGEGVEIGANTCIDRGTLGDTIVDDGAKIDNLVHVAHNVRVGKRSFVIALSMIGGSTVIDDDAWIAPGSVLRNGITIGQRALVGLGAVVTRSVAPDAVVVGNPAKLLERHS